MKMQLATPTDIEIQSDLSILKYWNLNENIII